MKTFDNINYCLRAIVAAPLVGLGALFCAVSFCLSWIGTNCMKAAQWLLEK